MARLGSKAVRSYRWNDSLSCGLFSCRGRAHSVSVMAIVVNLEPRHAHQLAGIPGRGHRRVFVKEYRFN